MEKSAPKSESLLKNLPQPNEAYRHVMNFALNQSASLPVPERILLTRSLAQMCNRAEIAEQLCSLADTLEAAHTNHAQITFQFIHSKP